MGELELHIASQQATINSHIITYGDAADPSLTEQIRDEIETMWNEPKALAMVDDEPVQINFKITALYDPNITQHLIYEDNDPRNNYFRIEAFAHSRISFVDDIGCNTGYFLLENLYPGSTTAAHEYGHTLGLIHPAHLDLRGQGVPGIMYPRGTLVDPEFQYNPAGLAGDSNNGGTMHPRFRRVWKEDIESLRLELLRVRKNKAVVGKFSRVWHPNHANTSPHDIILPDIRG